MALGMQRSSHAWLQQVAVLLGSKQCRPSSPRFRSLQLETLDRRIVLTVAPVATGQEPAPEPSLAVYASQEPVMGPIPAPIEDTSGTAATGSLEPDSSDMFFTAYYGEGEGDGSGSGSGTGSGTASGSGSAVTNQPPSVTASCTIDGDWITIMGTVTDDGSVQGLSVSIYGIVEASAITDENGFFKVVLPHPEMMGWIYVEATDTGGLTSEPYEIAFG